MTTTTSTPRGIINKQWNGKFDARIETIVYDQAKRNPSLPVIDGTWNGEPTVKYGIESIEAAIEHIRSFGFDGEILLNV